MSCCVPQCQSAKKALRWPALEVCEKTLKRVFSQTVPLVRFFHSLSASRRVTVPHAPYDALLVVGFGGPEKMDDVIPFLENVLRGRNVPRERMLEVARHYEHFGGRSPLNDQMRKLIAALQKELAAHHIDLPIFWGNRNWYPLLSDTLRQMKSAGVRRAMAYVASAYSSYSGCRQYLGNIERARQSAGPEAPPVDKLRVFFNHPLFIAANAARLSATLESLSPDQRLKVPVVFTAHSISASMAATCQYESQLRDTCRLTAEAAGVPLSRWCLVYQSRSGRPDDPWLGPDILDHLRDVRKQDVREVVVLPVGFLSDHIEVLYDLDYEARHVADGLAMHVFRAATVGTHPLFVQMLRELIEERLAEGAARPAVGAFPAWPDVCPVDCCPGPTA
jgi:ferrochelatase